MHKEPTMRMVEIEYLEWAGKRATVFESLRAVARAAQMLLSEHPLWLAHDSVQEALDALPAWVLEE